MSLIDLLFIQKDEVVCSFGTIPGIADHEGILVCLDLIIKKCAIKIKTIYDYYNADLDGLISYIKQFDFPNSKFKIQNKSCRCYF